MQRIGSTLVVAVFALLICDQVMAGTRLVHAVGRAAIANGDVAGARKSALAEALYDAAGQVRMSVRGSTMVSDAGTLREESGIVVSGQLKGYQVLDERREGDHFVVTIDALAETEEGECASSKKSDVAIGAIDIRVAPGLTGRVERQGREAPGGRRLEGGHSRHAHLRLRTQTQPRALRASGRRRRRRRSRRRLHRPRRLRVAAQLAAQS